MAPFMSSLMTVSLVFCWFLWLTATLINFKYPTPKSPVIVGGLAVPVASALFSYLLFGIFRARRAAPKRQYSTNLGNTYLTLTIAAVILPVLYWRFWHREMNRDVFTFSQDHLVSDTETILLLLKTPVWKEATADVRSDWTSQANLDSSTPGKCFIGWHQETPETPDCNTVEPGTTPCRCDGSWAENVVDFTWQNITYRALSFNSTESLVSTTPTTQLIIQAFFDFNSETARKESSHVLSPSLWIAIYDPTLTLTQALEDNYTRIILVNANGMTAINLGLNYRQTIGKAPAYDYGLVISTIPATDLPCDTSFGDATQKCFLSFFIQFPTFDRQVSIPEKAMSWEDAVAVAGSFFSLFQLVGWVCSGLAFHE
ncbi:hypothetical protein jhhlp_005022 [Lomentospora prolificans]|uniref:Uncharacterized protein n=1 Tax=Lomentospora prolificans TaxID=41688 RepID=A0A2N3N883_9PEZI|nr:hypothetical protein jhhlp_005022 [Lomentospora prolificans]